MAEDKKATNAVSAYLSEVGAEFKKITWPDRRELVDSTCVVICFIVILALIVLCCDKLIMLFLDLVLK